MSVFRRLVSLVWSHGAKIQVSQGWFPRGTPGRLGWGLSHPWALTPPLSLPIPWDPVLPPGHLAVQDTHPSMAG